jgi:hypothetical protein
VLTKKHIRRYLDEISRHAPSKDGRISDQVWQQLQEYLVRHYKRLDEKARAYADDIFDQLEGSIQKQIQSLPEGEEKRTLKRKLAIVRGRRPPVPVLYLDTPVLENLIRHALSQPSPGPPRYDSQAVWEKIVALINDGKLVCPEDTFRREALEMGDAEALKGLDIMRGLSKGTSFKHTQTIEDFQVFRALRSFIEGDGAVVFRSYWQDAFERKTVASIMKNRSLVTFEGALGLPEKVKGAETYKDHPLSSSTSLCIRYDEAALKEEQALEQRFARHLREMVRLGMRYETVKEGQNLIMEGFWAGQKTDLSLFLWSYSGGKPEGLEGLRSFYDSDHFGHIPAIMIRREMWKAVSEDGLQGTGRALGTLDINIVSAVLPYTDIMILGREMADLVSGRLGLDRRFNTKICSMDADEIIGALEAVAH